MLKFKCRECGESSKRALVQVETMAQVEVTSSGELFAEWSGGCIPDRIIDRDTLQCPKCNATGKIELAGLCDHQWQDLPGVYGSKQVRRVCDICGTIQMGITVHYMDIGR